MSVFTRPSRPDRPRRPARPSLPGGAGRLPALPGPEAQPRDQVGFGLGPWAEDLPGISKQYVSRAYEFFQADKRLPPSQHFGPTSGTIPELVVFGGLLVRGFTPYGGTARSFEFQSMQLGGRELPGGAVVDFILFHNNRRIGVRVESVFHALSDPFGRGASEVEEARRQKARLLARGAVDNIVDVNLASQGFALEHGPSAVVHNDFRRMLNG